MVVRLYIWELLTERLSGAFAFVEGDAGLSLFGGWRLSPALYMRFRADCASRGSLLERDGDHSGGREALWHHAPFSSSVERAAPNGRGADGAGVAAVELISFL